MSASPSINATTARYRIIIYLALIAAGLAGNYFKLSLFLNIDFLFGGIFAMLALQFFGLSRGILAAAMIASYTYILWNHPYAIGIMTAEVAVVGWLMERRRIGMVLADTIYWLIIGMPLVFLFYYGFMNVSESNAYITMTKQAVNGIANALIGRLLFTVYSLRSHTSLMSYRDVAYNLMAFFVLCPTVIFLVFSSRTDFNEIDRNIRTTLIHDSGQVTQSLATWAENRKISIINLAELAVSKSPHEMQPYIEQAKKSDVNYLRVGLADKEAISVAFSPLVDEMGKSTYGVSFAERPYVAILQQTLKPMLSEIIMGKVGITKPRTLMLAPVVIDGQFAGYVFGVLDFSQIRERLDKISENNTLFYTLLDKNNNVIMSNRSDQTIMTPFLRHNGRLNRLDGEISQWVPIARPNTPISERWEQSFYVAESTIDNLAEWKLILEQPIAPYQKRLYDNYTRKLFLLFLILLGSLVLAELLSRRFIATLENLRLITDELPLQLATNAGEIIWPRSDMMETHHLVNNFRMMAIWLTAQFNENRQINESLEHRVAERTAELAESEERLSTAAKVAYFGVYSYNFDTGPAYYSPEFLAIFGLPPDATLELDEDLITKALHPEDKPAFLACVQAASDPCGSGLLEHEHRIILHDGQVRWIRVIGQTKFSGMKPTDRPLHAHGIIQDITERKQVEKVLQQSEIRLKLALKANQNAVWDWDLQANELYYSPHWWSMIGHEENELAADPDLWRRLMHPDDLERANQVVSEALAGVEDSFQIETRLLHKQGQYVPILTRGFILRDANSTPVRVSGTNTDLTERKLVEEANRQLGQQLQQLEKTESLNRMAGAIAHTFNNLLGATMGYLEIAMEDLPPEGRSSKFLASAFQATERAAEVSRMMLTYLGMSLDEHISLDLSEVCSSSLATLKSLIKKDVVFASDLPSPGPIIVANAKQVQRLLRNLVINADEALLDEQGTITLIIRTVSSSDIPTAHRFPVDWQPQGDRFACLVVKDTGKGIAAKDIDKLFDPFFTSKFAGRGLGLAIVLGILKMHKGVVTVESGPDRGSVFQVYLPLSMEHVPLEQDTLTPIPVFEFSHTVLLVDDEQRMREMAETMLTRLGLVVFTAKDGFEAVEIFREYQNEIHLVLCDISMPGLNGWETLVILRKMVPTIPVIFISGHEETQVMQTDQPEYPQFFLQKPFKRIDLQRALETVLNA